MKHTKPLISIVIPTFNESVRLVDTLSKIQQADTLGCQKQIIVVDDASTDDTPALLKETPVPIRILTNAKNHGKGSAIKTGLLHTTGDIIVIQDADGEYDPVDYPHLIAPILDGYADVVYGSRFIGNKPHRVLYFWHYVANRALTIFSNMFTNLNLTDMETGYKVFRTDVIKDIAPKLQSSRFGFEPEITARLAKIPGIRMVEVGITYWGRTYQEGKKITWKDGVKALFQIVYYHFV